MNQILESTNKVYKSYKNSVKCKPSWGCQMIGKRIQSARKASGLSLRKLGEEVGVSHAAIKKYEDGLVIPTSLILLKLAKVLGVRTEYFFRPESISLNQIEYRKRNSLPKKFLTAIEHEVIDQIERRLELENLFPIPPVNTFKKIPLTLNQIKNLSEIEFIAQKIRSLWSLGSDPIPDLVDVLETNGVRVFMIDANIHPKFDGLAASINNMPIVVVGSNWSGDRQRFTLAHELGHLMLANSLSDDIDEELACNYFAGAFLLPKEPLLKKLGNHRVRLELKELALLKEEFGLSMVGILYRAQNLEIISPALKKSIHKNFIFRGWHISEPGTQYPKEKAHIFEQLVFRALGEDHIGESKAAELMKVSLSSFKSLRNLGISNASFSK